MYEYVQQSRRRKQETGVQGREPRTNGKKNMIKHTTWNLQVPYQLRDKGRRTSLKSMSMLERLRGSNPMSPTMLPSNPSGCGIKGIALLFAIMLTDEEGETVRERGIGAMKAEALARSAVNEATVAFMVSRSGVFV